MIVIYRNNEDPQHERRLLSIPTPDRFISVLDYLLDETLTIRLVSSGRVK